MTSGFRARQIIYPPPNNFNNHQHKSIQGNLAKNTQNITITKNLISAYRHHAKNSNTPSPKPHQHTITHKPNHKIMSNKSTIQTK
ncbi:MAG: hypothetical protein COA42_01175 [Alteromonadaceae bacterium]|nr:MAG: hypothetical protein COA42_01175 [Alteromonadaceae bacterium]